MSHAVSDCDNRIKSAARVLLVDDEREFVQTLAERLELRDMHARVAFDGPAAIQIVQQDQAPMVLVIDLKMPGMDGMQVLQQVKRMRPELPVIVLTGHGGEQDRQGCMQAGAFAYLQKPVNINQLHELLQQAYLPWHRDDPGV